MENNIIENLVLDYKLHPVDLLNNGEDENYYLNDSKGMYIRTVKDILSYTTQRRIKNPSVLGMGCFLGLVPIALSELGCNVSAVDIKEFVSNKNIQKRFEKSRVRYAECDLSKHKIPFADNSFDVVEMCEVLEHLNFNPVPVFVEISRVLVKGGLLYLTLPNISRLGNRTKFIIGRSIHNPIQSFFDQLNPPSTMIVGIHWREYTRNEIRELLTRTGFTIIQEKYETELKSINIKTPKKVMKRLLEFISPSLKPQQIFLSTNNKSFQLLK